MSVALRNLLLTFGLAMTFLAIAGSIAGSNGYEMLIVAMGWPHIVLGFLFNLGKVLRGEARARSSFILLVLLTLLLWIFHYSYSITGFISIYFTYHVFRDEVFIYFQTRARHKLRANIYVAGLVPFILLMFFVTDPRPQHYRQDLRRVELEASNFPASGWTLISFSPISYSRNEPFYFYLEYPNSKGPTAFNTLASVNESTIGGEMRVADKAWDQASDLIFKPGFEDDPSGPPPAIPALAGDTIPVSFSGDYRVGQTFKAERANLHGIWLPIIRSPGKPSGNFVFHLTQDTSSPLAPLTPTLQMLRFALIALLAGFVLWKAIPHFKQNRVFWLYFLLFMAIFASLQKVITAAGGSGVEFPVMFQLVVVFHYLSWYVFSFDKLRNCSESQSSTQSLPVAAFDRFLFRFQNISNFVLLVVGLNFVSALGVLWYTRWNGPAPLRYAFDYRYFLYFLVLHVTFSFAPKSPHSKPPIASQEVSEC